MVGVRQQAELTLLVAVLLLAFVLVLFVPTLSTYFGLTGPGPAVFSTVLPALALWFLALTACFRFRVLERVLGLERPGADPAAPGPG